MAKSLIQYACTECGGISPQWQGKCPHCLAWNTLSEVQRSKSERFSLLTEESQLQNLNDIQTTETFRQTTYNAEFDRVLGGGLVAGGVVLIGGDPGIGKSTLLLQALCGIASDTSPLYVSGEESAQQIALHAKRLKLSSQSLNVLAEIQLEKILQILQKNPFKVVVIDSIQTIYSETLQSAPGSVAQVKECAGQLTRFAKKQGITLILVGHVTKEGALAGPRILEHLVDTVLYFEGEASSSYRLIRAFKNRFGAVNELGVFAMTDKGLREVNNPSALFLSHHENSVAGNCITVTNEGLRPILLEIQALVENTSSAGIPRRLCIGLEQTRLAMLLAVLYRYTGISCFDKDVFINAVGGLKVSETATDLAVLLAIISSLKNNALPDKLVVFGEVGLAGEIRPVQRGQERLKESAKLGIKRAIIPYANLPKQALVNVEVIGVRRLEQAIEQLKEWG